MILFVMVTSKGWWRCGVRDSDVGSSGSLGSSITENGGSGSVVMVVVVTVVVGGVHKRGLVDGVAKRGLR